MADKITDERSPMWAVSAWGALAAGTGYGLYRAYPGLNSAVLQGNTDITKQTVNRLADMGRFNLGSTITTNTSSNAQQFLLERMSATSGGRVTIDVANSTYRSILSGGLASKTDALSARADILKQKDTTTAWNMARTKIGQYGGSGGMFDEALTRLGSGGVYDKERFDAFANAAMVTQSDLDNIGFSRRTIKMNQLEPEAYTNAMDFGKRLNVATKGKLKFNEFYEVSDVIDGRRVTTPVMAGRIGPQTVTIPLTDTGLMYGGEGLSSRYLTRGSFNEASDNLGFVERYVSQIENTAAQHTTTPGMGDAIRRTNAELLDITRTEQSQAISQAVWTVPEEVSTSGTLARNRLIREQTVWTGAGDFDEQMLNRMLSKGRDVYPYGSPDTVAKGTMMTSDIAQDLFGPMGRLVSPEQRPTQFVREWGITAESKRAAASYDAVFRGSFGEYYDRLDRKTQGLRYRDVVYGGLDATDPRAFSAPQLTTFYAKPELLAEGKLANMMFEEEMMLSKSATNMMEYERVAQKKIILDEGSEINKTLLKGMKEKNIGDVFMLDKPIDNGQFLGIERGSGRELFSRTANNRGVAEVVGGQISGDNTLSVFIKERQTLEGDQWWKFFSEDVKFMGRQRTDAQMMEAMRAAGVNANRIAGQDIEAIASGKLVGRNRMALMEQQMEALSMIGADKLNRGKLLPRDERFTRQFMSNPTRRLGVHKLSRATNLAATELEIQKNMVSVARRLAFSQEEMGLTFGMLDSSRAADLGIEEAVTKSRGVIGLSKMRLGDLASGGGAGGLGSMEATGFRALAMKGDEGQMFAAELATRMKGKTGLQTADRMAASMLGLETLGEKSKFAMGKMNLDDLKLGQLSQADLLKDTGRYVDVGMKLDAFGGSSRIYIPARGEDIVKRKLVDSGQLIDSPVKGDLDLMRRMLGDGAGKDEIEQVAKRLRNNVIREGESIASGGGKIIGSQYLTGIRKNASQSSDNTFGISRRAGNKMFDDLTERAQDIDQKEFITKQREQFLKGDTLMGGAWRHPTSGPESFQFVKYKMEKNLADDVMSVPMKRGVLEIDGKAQTVDLSQMVGMKGDFDRDQYNIAAITNRNTQERVAKAIDNQMADNYKKYTFDNYAMKNLMDRANNEKIPNVFAPGGYRDAMTAGMRDLTSAKVATPKVNIALQKLKLGMQHTAPDKYRPMADLFFHLEEAAISGKHGSLQGNIYQDIAHAVNQKDVKTMENVITQVMGDARQISGSIDGQKLSLDYDPSKFARVAIDAADAAGTDVDFAYKSVQASKGRLGNSQLNDLIAMHYNRRQGSVDVLPSLRQAVEYGPEGIEQGANRLLRRAGTKASAFSKALKTARAPMIAGAAIAAGVMMSAPSMSGSAKPYAEGPRGGRSLQHEDLGPPRGARMNPPQARIMSSPKAYDMTGIGQSSRANIRMSMADADVAGSAFMRQARLLSESGNTNIRTTDDRSILNPQRLASKIHERL